MLAAALVVGAALSATYVLSQSDTRHRGGVLRIVSANDLWYPQGNTTAFDPAIVNSEWHSTLAAMTADGLVGLRRAEGVRGNQVVPDLARTLPKPTDGGLTYTFHLRKGVRYSTGAPVLAGDIRRGIERTVVAQTDSYASAFFSATILGARSCQEAARKAEGVKSDCDLRDGITTDDRVGTVIFHLTEPTPDFVYRLALPAAAAVPQDSPVDLTPGTFLPATGPYRFRYSSRDPAATAHPRLELVRNPFFREWSPEAQPGGYPDRVVLETGYTHNQAVARVTDGAADLVWFGASLTDLDRLRTQHGSHLRTTPRAVTNMLFLNVTQPPFDSRDARRAVAYGLDRAALTGQGDFLSGAVTCQFLAPGIAGYERYCPFTLGDNEDGTWTAPDVTTAKALVRKSGTLGTEVVVNAHDDPALSAAGERIVDLLRRLGYRARLNLRPDYYAGDPGQNDWNAGLSSLAADSPTASNILPALGSCDPDRGNLGYNPGRYCNTAIQRQLAAANQQDSLVASAASHNWATIDRSLVDAAATIPYGNSVHRYFVGDRVGNTLVHPMTGPLIAQMWVK